MINKNKHTLLIAWIMISLVNGLKAYEINFTITGGENQTLYFGHYYGDKKTIRDSVLLNEQGKAVLSGDDQLAGGIYFIVLTSKKYVEFLVNDDDEFKVKSDTTDIFNNLQIEGAEETEIFLDYQKTLVKKQLLIRMLQQGLKDPKQDTADKERIEKTLEQIERQIEDLWKTTVENNPGTFVSLFIRSLVNVEIPEFDYGDASGNLDSLRWYKSYEYNKQHFFDHLPFDDERFLRTPVLYRKLEIYFNRILIHLPDSIIAQMNLIISKAKAQPAVYQFVLSYFLNKYSDSYHWVDEEIFAEIADKYYLAGKAGWANPELIESIAFKYTMIEPTLIGKTAPPLLLQDTEARMINIREIDSPWKMLYFWNPGCETCKAFTPEFLAFYDNMKDYGLTVIAIYTQKNEEEWLKYIKEHNLDWINAWEPNDGDEYKDIYNVYYTPKLILLDSNNRIISKDLNLKRLGAKLQ